MGEIPDIPWPEKGDAPFKEGAFGSAQANLDWLISPFLSFDDLRIAEAFKEAADKVVDNLESGSRFEHPDKFFFPVAYLYRHSFELSLKCIVKYGIDFGIIEKNDGLEMCRGREAHNLHKLWNKARGIVEEVWPNGDKETLTNAERVILQFHAIDNSGQAFRYTKDVEGNPHLENAPKLIDLVNLKKVSNNLFSFLDSCIGGLSNLEDCRGNY